MAEICTCGLLKARKAGTSMVDGYEVCSRCGKPLEFNVDDLGTTSPRPVEAHPQRTLDAASWVVAGALVLAFSTLIAIINANDDTLSASNDVVAILTSVGELVGVLIILVGVIAKGVWLGISMSRRD